MNVENRTIFEGDNLHILRGIDTESVDLIYLDPPFNSNRNYSAPIGSEAAGAAFKDTWTLSDVDNAWHGEIADREPALYQAIHASEVTHGKGMKSYLIMLAVRLLEMKRVLKSTGSIYLHCDPTASHYLKIILDAIFGTSNFRNEIVWQRTSAHNDGNRFGRVHDIILFYSKNPRPSWNPVYTEHDPEYIERFYRHEDERGRYRIGDLTGPGVRQGESGQPWQGVDPSSVGRCWSVPHRDAWPEDVQPPENYENLSVQERLDALDANGLIYWPPTGRVPGFRRYLSTSRGRRVTDVVTDINPLSSQSKERTGYPTQKPRALYERIVTASSNEGDLVLDPFCGCGTTLMAAETLNRRWIGIDLTYLATGAVRQQIERLFPQLRNSVTIAGTPEHAEQALELARTNPHGFEEWCVTHILHFRSNPRRGGDGGIDGTFRFPLGRIEGRQAYGKAVAQVKGGNYTLGHIRDFRTAMQNTEADLGVFVGTSPPTRGMQTEASRAGTYRHPFLDMEAPRLQIYEIQDYFRGGLPRLPFGERTVL